MEKLKKLFAYIGKEVLFTIFTTIILISLIAPIFDLSLEADGVKTEFSITFLDLFIGNNIGYIDLSIDFVTSAIITISLVSLILVWINFLINKVYKKDNNLISKINNFILIIAIILLAVSNLIFAEYSYIKDAGYKVEFNDIGFIIYLICLGGMALISLSDIFKKVHYDTHEIVEISMLISLAIVLDKFASIDIGATGGSFNFSGIPLLLIAVRYGITKSLISSSVVFSILTCLLDGYGLQTLPFDYVIAFSGYAFAGLSYSLIDKYLFKNNSKKEIINIIISMVIGGIGVLLTRMIGSSISSMIYYNYSLEAALAYNIVYVGPSAAICVVGGIILSGPLALINKLYPVDRYKKNITKVNKEEENIIEEK